MKRRAAATFSVAAFEALGLLACLHARAGAFRPRRAVDFASFMSNH